MDLFIPSGISFTQAMSQVTHLGIGAHQDDLEIMAFHGISECYHQGDRHFAGITCTTGSGSPRQGAYASYSNEEMRQCRHEEQRRAGSLGEYLFVAQLDFSSTAIQDPKSHHLAEALYELLQQLHPRVIYTHHPLDKHPTHRAVCRAVIEALRRLPATQWPNTLLGGEVWRSLDWVNDQDKISLDVSAHPELLEKLISIFDSQISGGKRYDLATLGRYRANATYATPHTTDQALLIAHAIDLMPLLNNTHLSFREFALSFVDRFRKQVTKELP
ncbi:MAG: PIG-L deacetylase family protein [Chthoniobacterales bacterium]